MTQIRFNDLITEYEECSDNKRKEELSEVIGKYRQIDHCGTFIGTIELMDQRTRNVKTCIHLLQLGQLLDDWDSPDGVSFIYDEYFIWPDNHYSEINGCYWGYISALDMTFCQNIDLTQMYDVSDEQWADDMCFNFSKPFDYSFLKKELKSYGNKLSA